MFNKVTERTFYDASTLSGLPIQKTIIGLHGRSGRALPIGQGEGTEDQFQDLRERMGMIETV